MKRKILRVLFILIVYGITVATAGEAGFQLENVARARFPGSLSLPGLGSIEVDTQGNVFVYVGKYNTKECFVLKLNRDLEFLAKIGRYGKGPGEFTTDYNSVDGRLNLDEDGNLYVFDRNPKRFVMFDNQGEYLRDIPLQKDEKGYFYGIGNIRMVNKNLLAGIRTTTGSDYRDFRKAGVLFPFPDTKELLCYPFIEQRVFVRTGSLMTMGVKETCYGDNCFADSDGRLIVFGNSQVYRFSVYDTLGTEIVTVERPHVKMHSFSRKELTAVADTFARLKENNFRHYKSLISQIETRKNVIADIKLSLERIFVFPVREDITVENQYPVEIFDLTGSVINTGQMKRIPDKIWKNNVFFIETDEDGDPIIELYRFISQSVTS